MATLLTQDINITNTALTPSYAAAAGGGDAFTPDADTFIHVKNSDSASHTVTIPFVATLAGRTVISIAVAVAAGTERMIGPFPANLFADPANSGLASVTYTAVTGVTIAAIRARPLAV